MSEITISEATNVRAVAARRGAACSRCGQQLLLGAGLAVLNSFLNGVLRLRQSDEQLL